MDSKKTKIISIVSIIALAAILVGATYAYFQAQTGEGSQTDIKINANTVDTFNFETGDPLSINLNQENFASGKGNQTGSTYAKAILTANNKTNSATNKYYLYLNISNNTFGYTQDENTPEIILTIKDGSNTELTSVTGLSYKTVTDGKGNIITGFDITNKDGLITIFSNRSITTTSTTEETWNVTVTFVNYNLDQSANAGKRFNAKLMVQKEKMAVLADYVISKYTGTQGENGIYYHDSSLDNGAEDNSYRYAGADPNNFVCFGSDASTCPTDNLYRIIGVFGDEVKLIKYDYANSNLLGTDGDYNTDTFLKSNYSTYKGELATINKYFWNYKNDTSINDGEGSNTWSTSLLNKINLNTNFINNVGEKWANKIAIATWKIGGAQGSILNERPSLAYQNEIVNSSTSNNTTEYSAKIGLMYISDYGFSADPSAWTITMGSYDGSSNWMYMGLSEWTMISNSSTQYEVFGMYYNGYLDTSIANNVASIRPSFYLKSSITYVSGSGTQSDPIRIN